LHGVKGTTKDHANKISNSNSYFWDASSKTQTEIVTGHRAAYRQRAEPNRIVVISPRFSPSPSRLPTLPRELKPKKPYFNLPLLTSAQSTEVFRSLGSYIGSQFEGNASSIFAANFHVEVN